MQSPHVDAVRPTRAVWPTARPRPRSDRPREPAAVRPAPHGPSGTPTRAACSSGIRPGCPCAHPHPAAWSPVTRPRHGLARSLRAASSVRTPAPEDWDRSARESAGTSRGCPPVRPRSGPRCPGSGRQSIQNHRGSSRGQSIRSSAMRTISALRPLAPPHRICSATV